MFGCSPTIKSSSNCGYLFGKSIEMWRFSWFFYFLFLGDPFFKKRNILIIHYTKFTLQKNVGRHMVEQHKPPPVTRHMITIYFLCWNIISSRLWDYELKPQHGLKNNIGIYDVQIIKLMLLIQIIYNFVENILFGRISKLTFAPLWKRKKLGFFNSYGSVWWQLQPMFTNCSW